MEFDLETSSNIALNVQLNLRVIFQFTLSWMKNQLKTKKRLKMENFGQILLIFTKLSQKYDYFQYFPKNNFEIREFLILTQLL